MNTTNPTTPVESTVNIENVTVLSTKPRRNLKKTLLKTAAYGSVAVVVAVLVLNKVNPDVVEEAVSAATPE